jgi:hypothetical protein
MPRSYPAEMRRQLGDLRARAGELDYLATHLGEGEARHREIVGVTVSAYTDAPPPDRVEPP